MSNIYVKATAWTCASGILSRLFYILQQDVHAQRNCRISLSGQYNAKMTECQLHNDCKPGGALLQRS